MPREIWLLLGVLAAFGLATEGILFYGNSREKLGRADEAARWANMYAEAQHRVYNAQSALQTANNARDRAIAERDVARAAALGHTQTEILNAPDARSAYAAYLAFHNRMRDDAAARRTQRWADYSASVAAAPNPGSGPAGPSVVGFAPEASSGCDFDQPVCLGFRAQPV